MRDCRAPPCPNRDLCELVGCQGRPLASRPMAAPAVPPGPRLSSTEAGMVRLHGAVERVGLRAAARVRSLFHFTPEETPSVDEPQPTTSSAFPITASPPPATQGGVSGLLRSPAGEPPMATAAPALGSSLAGSGVLGFGLATAGDPPGPAPSPAETAMRAAQNIGHRDLPPPPPVPVLQGSARLVIQRAVNGGFIVQALHPSGEAGDVAAETNPGLMAAMVQAWGLGRAP